MGRVFLNGVDYSAPSLSGVSGVKGDKETTYRQGQVNITPANLGAATETSVNNIINGTTQVGDSGKLGGETAEQWNQKIADAKPEEIDGILNGTIPVGDSNKLGSETATWWQNKINNSLGYSKVLACRITSAGWNRIGEIPVDTYSWFDLVVKKTYNSTPAYMYKVKYTESRPVSDIVRKLSVLFADISASVSAKIRVVLNGSKKYIEIYQLGNSDWYTFELYSYKSPWGGTTLTNDFTLYDEPIAVSETPDGTLLASKDIPQQAVPLTTADKPTGTYTGNGSTTSRTILTGGIGNTCILSSVNGMAIVTEGGASAISSSGSYYAISKSQLNFKDGALTMASADAIFNASGIEVKYQIP